MKTIQVDPNDVIIIGYDTDDGPEHALYDPRAKEPVSRHLCKSIEEEGFQSVIQLKETAEGLVVISGRQRVKAARKVAEKALPGLKIDAVVAKVNAADAQKRDAFLNGAVVTFTPAHQAAKAAAMKRAGHDEATIARALGKGKKTIQNYLKYDENVSQEVKNALEGNSGVTVTYLKPDDEKEYREKVFVKFGDVVKANLWNESEVEQSKWLRRYILRAKERIERKFEPKTEPEQYPPEGGKFFGKGALRKFAKAFMLLSPYDAESDLADLARDHRGVIGDSISDDFAMGILFACADLRAVWTQDDPERLQKSTGLDLSVEQIKAFRELWKLSQK